MKFLSKEKALTLIELLVIIGIIGILATLLLYGIAGMRWEGRDSRIIKNMDSLRTVATLHRQDTGDYSDFCESLKDGELHKDIEKQGGKTIFNKDGDIIGTSGKVYCYNEDYNYCAKVQLNSGYWWCVDNKGTSKTFSEDPFISDCGISYDDADDSRKQSLSCESDEEICCKIDSSGSSVPHHSCGYDPNGESNCL